MKPEILIWALLFVVSIGLAYRVLGLLLHRTAMPEADATASAAQPATTLDLSVNG